MKIRPGQLPLFLVLSLAAVWPVFADSIFPQEAPVRERFMNLDEQSSWTLRRGEKAVPLAVTSLPNQVAISLSGGWILLGPDLDFAAYSLDFLSMEEVARFSPSLVQGTPWVQSWGSALLFVTGSPGKLAVLYPETGVCMDQDMKLADMNLFAVTNKGFLYTQGRRTSGQAHWNKLIREEQPLLFFPSDLTAAPDGTAWACDSLQARPWRLDGDFWRPLELPQTVGRMTSLSPFPDSSGYFASGDGWVGAFSQEGTKLWSFDKDLSGQDLPRDIKVRCGEGRLYLWSAQARRVWVWLWTTQGLKGHIATPSGDVLADYVRQEIKRFTATGSLPQAAQAAAAGEELAKTWLNAQPFSFPWKQAREEFAEIKRQLRQKIVGNGELTLTWSAPYGKPLADWVWEPDASLPTEVDWTVVSQPFWEGRAYEKRSFKIALKTSRAPWPGVENVVAGPLQLPSFMVVEITPTEKKKPAPPPKKKAVKNGKEQPAGPPLETTTPPVPPLSTWIRVKLPMPVQPYDLPVE